MNRLKSMLFLFLLTAITPLLGQQTQDGITERPNIEVTGTAEMEIVPDEIYISITIKERHEGKEKITIEKQESDLKEALKAADIPLENLTLTDAIANYIRVSWMRKDVIVKTEYLLKVTDAVTVGVVFEKLDEIKIYDANISKVSHSELEAYKREVRIMAIKAAKEKAEYLLTAIGEKVGKAILVHEQPSTYKIQGEHLNYRGSRGRNTSGYNMDQSDTDKIVQFQKIKLQAAIYVKFEIEASNDN